MPAQDFSQWMETPLGRYVLDWELDRHDRLVADIFGFNAIQLGWPGLDFLRANRMPFRLRCATGEGAGLRADPHRLPLASNSVDLVILAHVLEFDSNPHQILREVERVLVPEGSVIVTGFNPYSLWGLQRRLLRRPLPPWRRQCISIARLKDWFALLGLEAHAGAFGCYRPALGQERWLRRLAFLDAAGDRWWPIAGAVYVIQGIKRQQGMRLITPVWQDRKARAKRLLPVTQKTEQ
jgi:SAM-dependent methyltransferase